MAAWSEIQAVRSMTGVLGDFFEPGSRITVSINVTGDPNSLTIIEQPPANWIIDRVLDNGVFADGFITWQITESTTRRIVLYQIAPPANAVENGVFSGKAGEVEIAGQNILFSPKPTPGKQVPMQTGLTYPYWLYLPDNYDEEGHKWPMIFYLTGGPTNEPMSFVIHHGIPQMLNDSSNREKFPSVFECIIVSPHPPSSGWWKNTLLYEVMSEILSNYSIDFNRIYVVGQSLGGIGAWSFSSAYPELIAAAIPVAGADVTLLPSGDTKLAVNYENLENIPIWAFHGADDTVLPEELAAQTVNNLLALGGNVRYTVYPSTGHDSMTPTLNNPEVYQWLFQQNKSQQSAVLYSMDLK